VIVFPGFPVAGAGSSSCNSLVILFLSDGRADRIKHFSGKSYTTYAPATASRNGPGFLGGHYDDPEMSKAISDWLESGPDHEQQ